MKKILGYLLLGFCSNYGISQENLSFLYTTVEGNKSTLYLSNIDGAKEQKLFEYGGYIRNPQISPNGTEILFIAEENPASFGAAVDEDLREPKAAIFIYDFSTDKVRTVSSLNYFHSGAIWTHDGEWIIYSRKMGEKHYLYKMKPDASGIVQLSDTKRSDQAPQLSPDGKTIVYQSLFTDDGENYTCDIFTMDINGEKVVNLTNGEIGQLSWRPRFSHDGKYIAFVLNDSCGSQVCSMKADGSEMKKLFTLQPCGECYSEGPYWSPIDNKLLFHTCEGIYLCDANGENLMQIHKSGYWPTWLPEGNQILFIDGNNADVFTMKINDYKPLPKTLRQLTDTKVEEQLGRNMGIFLSGHQHDDK